MAVTIEVVHQDGSVRVEETLDDFGFTDTPRDVYESGIADAVRRASGAMDSVARVIGDVYPSAARALEDAADNLGADDWKDVRRFREAAALLWPVEYRND